MHSSKIASCWLLDRRVHKVPVTLCCTQMPLTFASDYRIVPFYLN